LGREFGDSLAPIVASLQKTYRSNRLFNNTPTNYSITLQQIIHIVAPTKKGKLGPIVFSQYPSLPSLLLLLTHQSLLLLLTHQSAEFIIGMLPLPNSTQSNSTQNKIYQHERNVWRGIPTRDCCPVCLSIGQWKCQRRWQRGLRLFDVDPTSSQTVVTIKKITLARWRCVACKACLTDYPDFRLAV
jgi:hypothetical protein